VEIDVGVGGTPGGESHHRVPPESATTSQAAAGFGSNWTVYHQDPLGSVVDPTGTNLDPAQLAWTSPSLDGQLYGEPLVEDGRVIVATENNTVYSALGEIFVVDDQLTGTTHYLVGLSLFTGAVLLDQLVDPPGSDPL
jgi:hypothetical protein